MPTTAYSYIRFSTTEQLKGDSLRRQLSQSKEYCQCNGFVLDVALTLRDMGVSAWRGRNVKHGALGAFLRAAETGQVKKGSVLIVESLDRISRQKPIDALALWLQILQAGVSIHTLNPKRQYSADSDQLAVFAAVIILSRANEES
jgi:DNA invertase Pin-like site-specific DNA recombinase